MPRRLVAIILFQLIYSVAIAAETSGLLVEAEGVNVDSMYLHDQNHDGRYRLAKASGKLLVAFVGSGELKGLTSLARIRINKAEIDGTDTLQIKKLDKKGVFKILWSL